MDKQNKMKNPSDLEQLKKYAEDLSEVYKSAERGKKELEASQGQLLKYANALNNTITELKESNKELQEAYSDTIHRLVLAAEFKDQETGDHIVRMSNYCALLAEKLRMPAKVVQDIKYAAPMHDVGKIGIPDNILSKPGKLADEEFRIMSEHTTIGANILAGSKADILKIAQQIALTHHEKWNGKGYPQGLSKKKIPIAGRIVGLADVFDALTSIRPYKEPYPLEAAIEIIKLARGEHFDPELVDCFLKNIQEIVRIKNEVDSHEDLPSLSFVWSERDQQEGMDKKIRLSDLIRQPKRNK
ncbi:MAG: HD domain-containing protein [Candidatus Aminicenantes bacterium]|nr:HD domain-containing protein [Candidatus Aminicenantes bacterium]